MDLSRHAQHCIIHFLCAKGAGQMDIYSHMKHVYGDECFHCTAVSDWCKRFKESRSKAWDASVTHSTLWTQIHVPNGQNGGMSSSCNASAYQ
jgi:hypothetical protein